MFANAQEAQKAFDAKVAEVSLYLNMLPPGACVMEVGNALVFRSVIEEYPGIWRAQVDSEGDIIWESLLELNSLSESLASLENDAADWEAAVQDLTHLLQSSKLLLLHFDLDVLLDKMDAFAE